MSSFLCSKNHYIKTRDLSYNLILDQNKYFCYWDNVDINTSDHSILEYLNNNIIELIKINAKSVNDRYNLNEKENNYILDYIKDIELTKPKTKYFITLEDLIGLYNAYKCINYQIDLNYDKKFIHSIQKLIADKITELLSDRYDYNEINKWEYGEV